MSKLWGSLQTARRSVCFFLRRNLIEIRDHARNDRLRYFALKGIGKQQRFVFRVR